MEQSTEQSTETRPYLNEACQIVYNQDTGNCFLKIFGDFSTPRGYDSPVVEIFNAVQAWKKLDVSFTPLNPVYDPAENLTTCRFVPNNARDVPPEEFFKLSAKNAELLNQLFIPSLEIFLGERYDAYLEALNGPVSEEKALVKNFITNRLRLPPPPSKKVITAPTNSMLYRLDLLLDALQQKTIENAPLAEQKEVINQILELFGRN